MPPRSSVLSSIERTDLYDRNARSHLAGGGVPEFRSPSELSTGGLSLQLSPVCLLVLDDQVGSVHVDRDARDTLHAIEGGRCRASHGESLRPCVNGGTGHRGI